MDIFECVTLLVAIGLLLVGFLRRDRIDAEAYRKAITFLVAAWILYYPVSALFMVGVYVSFVARPVGFVLGVLSFRLLCLALFTGGPTRKDE